MLLTIVAFVVVLGITITIHEFGHFAMAKLLKIRVLIFSLGFGPKILGFTRGETEYRLSPFPIGGYVKMAGEAYDEERKGDPGEFLSHPKWHRLLVAVAGPMMNILLAVAILTFSYMQGVPTPRYPKEAAVIGPVTANTPARRAGLQTGDRVLSVNTNRVSTWQDLEVALETAPRDAINLEVSRNGEILQLHIEPPANEKTVDSGVLGFRYPLPRTIVYSVDINSPAYKAGLREGDEILSVRGDGRFGKDYNQILNIISESEGIPLKFEIRRPEGQSAKENLWDSAAAQQGRMLSLTITPIMESGRAIIGFAPDYPSDMQKYGLVGALAQSVRSNYEFSTLTFTILGRILKGSASVQTLTGPIGIAKISGSVARSAARARSARVFFEFLGLISLQLGVFNLLPIPILDGGVIALLLIEGVIGRDLSMHLKEKIVQVGFVFLILLMGFVVFNDLSKILNLEQLFR